VVVSDTVVSRGDVDLHLTSNTATAANPVLATADLAVVKFSKPDTEVRIGERLTYTAIVDNLGLDAAHRVTLYDPLQSSGQFALVSVDTSRPADCSPLTGTFDQRPELTCELNDPLVMMTPTDWGRWIVTLVLTASTPQDTNNVVRVVSDGHAPVLADNVASDAVAVSRWPSAKASAGGFLASPQHVLDRLTESWVGLAMFLGSVVVTVLLGALRRRRTSQTGRERRDGTLRQPSSFGHQSWHLGRPGDRRHPPPRNPQQRSQEALVGAVQARFLTRSGEARSSLDRCYGCIVIAHSSGAA
jgi:uncharacterized repeat protein (TIGR01451 family)